MKEIVKFKDWAKLELRVGEVKEIIKDRIIINCCNKDFEINLNLDVNKGDKIVIGINGDKVIVPVVNNGIPITPEKDAGVGWKIC